MKYECRKIENCFANTQSYEYKLPVAAWRLRALLDEGWSVRVNEKLRRPVFIAEREATTIKGVLSEAILRLSFADEKWKTEKDDFERWLENINV